MTTQSSTASDAPGTATPPASASEDATTPAPTGDAQAAGTTPETPPTDAPPVDPPAPEPAPPAPEVTITVPDDSPLDAAAVERLAAFSRERGLTQEAAQGVADEVAAMIAERDTAFLAAHQPGGAVWEEQNAKWQAEALADPEIGGTPEQLAANVGVAKHVLAEFFPAETLEFLQSTGLGSNPAVVRGFVKLGRTLQENGKLVLPGASAPQRSDAKWYPSMQSEPAA